MNRLEQPEHLTDDERLGRTVLISPKIHKKEGKEVTGVITRIDHYPSNGDEIWYVQIKDGSYSGHANFFRLLDKQEGTRDDQR